MEGYTTILALLWYFTNVVYVHTIKYGFEIKISIYNGILGVLFFINIFTASNGMLPFNIMFSCASIGFSIWFYKLHRKDVLEEHSRLFQRLG